MWSCHFPLYYSNVKASLLFFVTSLMLLLINLWKMIDSISLRVWVRHCFCKILTLADKYWDNVAGQRPQTISPSLIHVHLTISLLSFPISLYLSPPTLSLSACLNYILFSFWSFSFYLFFLNFPLIYKSPPSTRHKCSQKCGHDINGMFTSSPLSFCHCYFYYFSPLFFPKI